MSGLRRLKLYILVVISIFYFRSQYNFLPTDPKKVKESCAEFPAEGEIERKREWTTLKSNTSSLYLFSAFYDNRQQASDPLVRVIAIAEFLLHDTRQGKLKREVFKGDKMGRIYTSKNMTDVPAEFTTEWYCQMWFEGNPKPHISKVTDIRYIWHSSEGYNEENQPYILSCPIERSNGVPAVVSLVENPCDKATNLMKVTYNTPPKKEGKKKFAVCVKGLDFLEVDLSVLILEWLETVLALGADKVFVYEFSVHPNIKKVLTHYTSLGKLDVRKISLPGNQPNEEGQRHRFLVENPVKQFQNEQICYNDCFYRNIHRYEYIAILDIDEIIVPRKLSTWFQLMNQVPSGYASYSFRMAYFMPGMENQGEKSNGHIINNVVRSKNHTQEGWLVKCFHSTDHVVATHNHFPISCFEDCSFQKKSYSMPVELAHLHHYRKECSDWFSKDDCERIFKKYTVKDTCFSAVRKDIIKNATRIMKALDLSPT